MVKIPLQQKISMKGVLKHNRPGDPVLSTGLAKITTPKQMIAACNHFLGRSPLHWKKAELSQRNKGKKHNLFKIKEDSRRPAGHGELSLLTPDKNGVVRCTGKAFPVNNGWGVALATGHADHYLIIDTFKSQDDAKAALWKYRFR